MLRVFSNFKVSNEGYRYSQHHQHHHHQNVSPDKTLRQESQFNRYKTKSFQNYEEAFDSGQSYRSKHKTYVPVNNNKRHYSPSV